MAGAALFAVPVGVAALIGFGASLSGVAGGLSAVTTGPDTAPASDATPVQLSSTVAPIASRSNSSEAAPGQTTTVGPGGDDAGDVAALSPTTDSGGSGDGSDGPGGDVVDSPNTPGLPGPLGGGGGSGETPSETVNGTVDNVNNVLGGLNNTVGGLLGK